MKTTGLPNPFRLIPVRRIAQDFLAFFLLTESDTNALLFAYGLYGLDVDLLPNDRRNKQKRIGANSGKVSRRKRSGEPPLPIPIGVHPDFMEVSSTTAALKRLHRSNPKIPSSTSPTPSREPISDPSNEPDHSTENAPMPATLSTAFAETVEECNFNWPESLRVEKAYAGIVEIVAGVFVLAGLIALAERIILS
jgi:hypothetical protein